MKNRKLLIIMTLALLSSGCGNTKSATIADTAKEQVETEAKLSVSSDPDTTSCPTGQCNDENMSTDYEEFPSGKISVARWDDLSLDFYVDLSMYYASNTYEYSATYDTKITPEENMKSICQKNKQYFVDNGTYKDYEGNTHDAAFFFKNNNAYVIYNEDEYEGLEKKTKYTYAHLINRMIWDELDYSKDSNEYIVKVPFPVYVRTDYFDVKECWDKDERWDEKNLFSLCSFDEAKEFYDMFSEGTAIADEDSKVIKVRGTISSKIINEDKPVWAILDFKNKTYEVQYEDGTLCHSFESMYDDIENSYKSAGIIDGKEVIYDAIGINGNDIFVIENGKRRMIMDSEKMQSYLDKISGWSCVGESLELKLTKIKGNKYYFDVTATMKEDGEWTHHDTLVVKDEAKK